MLAVREQDLGQPTRGLAERAAVLEGRERPDRVAAQALGESEIPLVPRHDREAVEHAPERPGNRGLLVEGLCLLELPLRLVVILAVDREVASRGEGVPARDDRAASLGQLERAVEERRRLVVLLACVVDAGEVDGGPALEVLAPGFLRQRKLVTRVPL